MIDRLIIRATASIRESLPVLDDGGLRTALVVDPETGVLQGLLTDGDLRRAFMAGANFSTPVGEIMNRHFTKLPLGTPETEIRANLSNRIAVIPLVDPDGRPVEVATFYRRANIPAAEPVFEGNESGYVLDCLQSGWISSAGAYIPKFEAMFGEYTGQTNAVAVSNGTTALHLALATFRVGPGDEVIVPDLTFAATVNAVLHVGATPVLIDVDPETLALDPAAAEAAITPRTRAIMPVHLFGQMADMDRILDLAERHDLLVVEDAAQALGSRIGSRHAGTFGHAGTFSFFGNKLITTGEGGMVLFRDAAMADRGRMLRDHGIDRDRRYWHLDVGFNFRMTNMQAAVGVAQMERVHSLLAAKIRLASLYRRNLMSLNGPFELLQTVPGTTHSHWSFPVLIRGGGSYETRDVFLGRLREAGLDVRPLFYPLHEMPPYRSILRINDCPVASRAARRGFTLPSSPRVSDEEVDYICHVIAREQKRVSWNRLAERMQS